jgi:hypothetical protein
MFNVFTVLAGAHGHTNMSLVLGCPEPVSLRPSPAPWAFIFHTILDNSALLCIQVVIAFQSVSPVAPELQVAAPFFRCYLPDMQNELFAPYMGDI